MDEDALQKHVEKLLDEDRLIQAIEGTEAIATALAQSRDDGIWPHFPVDYLSRVRIAEAAGHVLSRLHSLEPVSKSTRSLSLAGGESMYADLLYCSAEYATFVLLELKVGKQTPRQVVTELLAYEQEIMNHCPFLSQDDLVFVVIGTDFRTTIDHALAGMMTWSRRKILCLRADLNGDSVRLRVHLPKAWSPVGQGILPAGAVATADLCFYPKEDLTTEQIEMLAMTAMDLIVREADRTGTHGFVMLWDDAMYPEVARCPIALTVGIVNPFAFLSEAVNAGILSPDRTAVQKYLLGCHKYEDLASAHNWTRSVGKNAILYLERWCDPAWEGLSTWHALRSTDRVHGPAHLLERRAMPRAFEFFGVVGEHVREITARTTLRSAFIPSTVRPDVDWKHPRLGATLLDSMTLPQVVEMGQWTFGAFFELGLRLGRFVTVAEAYRHGDERIKAKLAARLFWIETDLWEPLHALQDRCNCTDELNTTPPKIVFAGYSSERDVRADVQQMAQWIVDQFIGTRKHWLKIAFELGLESHGLFDAAIIAGPDGTSKEDLTVKVATAARDLLSASVDHLLADGTPEDDCAALWQALEDLGKITSTHRLSRSALQSVIASIPDDRAVALLPDAIIPLVDRWCPQLWHRLAPAALSGMDWAWVKQQIADLRSQGMSSPGVMLWPNAEVTTADLSALRVQLPRVSDPKTHVLACVHAGLALIIEALPWTEIEKDGFRRIEEKL